MILIQQVVFLHSKKQVTLKTNESDKKVVKEKKITNCTNCLRFDKYEVNKFLRITI